MRDATIATSRTRATTDRLIDYRPLPAEWGDVRALRAVRAEKSRAADRGLDPSILEIERVPAEGSQRTARPHRRRGLLAALRSGPAAPRRRGHGGEHLATV